MGRSTKTHISSNKILLHSAFFLLALLPTVMSTDEAAVVSCCSTGNYSNIDNVFKHAQSLKDRITIHIQPGNYTLSGSYQFHSKSRISIQGSGENSTVLNCDKSGNGITFFNSNEIKVSIEFTSNVTCHMPIYACGKKSTTKGLSVLKQTYLLSNCTFLENQEMPGHMIIANLCDHFPLSRIFQTFDNITSPECSFVLRIINCTFLNNQTSHCQTAFQKLNNNQPCPPGYGRKNTSSPCECLPHSFAGYVTCQQEKNSSIFIGYCISYSEIEIKRKPSKQVIVASCPLFSGFQVSGPTIPLPMDVNQLDEAFCTEHWSRTGKLCNKCTNGTGISVFSITYNCIECTESVTNWLIYIAVTILPLTLFFLIVVIFQVGVISSQANGYIFFSQIITIPPHELIIEAAWALALKDNTTAQHVLTNLLLFPYSVWSFDFFHIFYARDICLHKSMRIIHVLALQYIPALYPLFLVIVSYILIELHARNCRPLVWLWKPFCFLCVRFRRNWEAKTSIIDAFATFLILSYTKILLVSFSLLTPANVYVSDGSSVETILNNDPSVDFFQGDHLPFAILALVILLTIGAIPPLLLLLYPSHRFQKLLTFFKLQSHGLQTFVDAFQGCYKNRANGGPERRYFAGIYFLFRIIVFLIFTTATSIQKMFTALQITYTVYILAFVIFRPYKKDRYNILDAVFITILAVISTTAAYIYTYLLSSTKFLNGLWYFTYALLHIPTLYMAGYIIYWFFSRSRCIQTHCIKKIGGILYHYTHLSQARRPTTFSVSDFPDRVQNPHRYEDSPHLDDEDHENELPNAGEHVSLLEEGRQRRHYI